MEKHCRDMGAEDLVKGAKWCIECFRYKSKENQCRDFKYGGVKLKGPVETAGGRVKWSKERE